MPDDILTSAGITYGRRTVKLVWTYPVTVSTLEEEQRVCDWLMKGHGWHLLNRVDAGDGWTLNFTFTDLVADSDRGDGISYTREYEVANA